MYKDGAPGTLCILILTYGDGQSLCLACTSVITKGKNAGHLLLQTASITQQIEEHLGQTSISLSEKLHETSEALSRAVFSMGASALSMWMSEWTRTRNVWRTVFHMGASAFSIGMSEWQRRGMCEEQYFPWGLVPSPCEWVNDKDEECVKNSISHGG